MKENTDAAIDARSNCRRVEGRSREDWNSHPRIERQDTIPRASRGKNNKIELQNSCLNGCRQRVESTRQQAVDATQLAIQAQSVAQFASTTVSAYETRLGGI